MHFKMAPKLTRKKKQTISNFKGRIKFVELINSGSFYFGSIGMHSFPHATISKLARKKINQQINGGKEPIAASIFFISRAAGGTVWELFLKSS